MKNKKTRIFCGLLSIVTILFSFTTGANKTKALTATTNSSAEFVIGQQNLLSGVANQGGSVGANTLYSPTKTFYDGTRFFIVDTLNNRVLIYNHIPVSNNESADVVVGQSDMSHNGSDQGGSVDANTLDGPFSVYSDGTRLIISDSFNCRVLIYNHIPTTDNASADVVIGQQNMTSSDINQGNLAPDANTLNLAGDIYSDGTKLIISDIYNSRVLIYNHIPTTDNASADVVIGQQNMTSGLSNQGGSAGANTLNGPSGVFSDGTRLFIYDGYLDPLQTNSRVLIYNHIPTTDNASADVVIGQPNMTSGLPNQGGTAGAKTLSLAGEIYFDGTRLFIADGINNRLLIFNSLPSTDNASADVVIGQPNMTSTASNQGGTVGANTLSLPSGILILGSKLYISDTQNNRILAYKLKPALSEITNIGTTQDSTPNYTFNSDEAGTITYGGDCFSATTMAVSGNNTITFSNLSVGAHSNCTVTVTDGAGFSSSVLSVSAFSISSGTSTSDLADPNVNTTNPDITTNTPALSYSGKKSANRKITFTLWGKHIFPKAKSKYFSLKLNGKRARVIRARNRSNNLFVTVKLKYGRWARGSYNLTLTYRSLVNKRWQKESFRKDNILNIN